MCRVSKPNPSSSAPEPPALLFFDMLILIKQLEWSIQFGLNEYFRQILDVSFCLLQQQSSPIKQPADPPDSMVQEDKSPETNVLATDPNRLFFFWISDYVRFCQKAVEIVKSDRIISRIEPNLRKSMFEEKSKTNVDQNLLFSKRLKNYEYLSSTKANVVKDCSVKPETNVQVQDFILSKRLKNYEYFFKVKANVQDYNKKVNHIFEASNKKRPRCLVIDNGKTFTEAIRLK